MTSPDSAPAPSVPPLAPSLITPVSPNAETPLPRRTGWWRRNAFALGAIAVLLPATIATIGLYEWWGYFSGRAVIAIDPDPNGLIEHAGVIWGPIVASEANSTDGLVMPPNTRLLIAKVPVDPQNEPAHCTPPELVEQSTGRRWVEMRLELGIPSNSEEPTTCVPGATDPYDIFVPFIVPEDSKGPYWIEINTFTAPEFVRFTIDP